MEDALYIGLMSGTSVDAIDCALVRSGPDGTQLLATHQHTIPDQARARIAAISQPGDNEIERLGPLDRELGELFGHATLELLRRADREPEHIHAVGSHGQTVRHRPPSGGANAKNSFTLQLGDPNTIAEITGITTVADFRRRDMAAGGEGAPLAPAFHAATMAAPGINRAIVNIGGIANATLLQGEQLRVGFDTGPGNTLLDHWVQRHHHSAFDRDGAWASSSVLSTELLASLSTHDFFARSGPRSTGKEVFNLAWLDARLAEMETLEPGTVQATLAQLTAQSIATGVAGCGLAVDELYVCGGGAHNSDLLRRLESTAAPATVATTAALGIDPDWVEAMAFAWLARRTLEGLAGNAPAVTGASGERVLGGIYPGQKSR